jgi:SAM-dependent methyltransferase
MIASYQPILPISDPEAAEEIKLRTELDWFHRIRFGEFVTPGYAFEFNWEFVAAFLQKHGDVFQGASVLEPGCADGLWTMWFAKLGCRDILATDIANRDQFRLVARALGLPVEYVPEVLSTRLPTRVRRQFDVVASLGLLYHVHDPFTTLAMYRRYLRPGGWLILETGACRSDAAYMQYTGAGQVYGKDGGNQFLQSVGFMRSALDELGMTLVDHAYRSDGRTDELGNDIGRGLFLARKDRRVEVHYYSSLLEELGMLGEPFAGEKWYDHTV